MKGATVLIITQLRDRCVSIHAPVKGATEAGALAYILLGVSIHAPVKGAT